MEGDLAKLPEIVELKHKYNCSIMVDEAHGIGVFGDHGRGVCDYFGLTDEVDLIMGTFSKSLASIGGFIAGDKDTINFLRHNCRTYIFSASNTPAATAAALEALHILQKEPERIEALWKVTKYALKRFLEEGNKVKVTIMFRGRELSHPELGREILGRVAEQLKDSVSIERDAKLEGKNMIMILAPKAASKGGKQ